MKKFFITTLLAGLALTGGAAPADVYVNSSPATTLPQVDATAFINRSTIDLFTTLPWRAQNVQNWTNTGIMTGSPGYQFQYDRSGKTTSRRVRANSKNLTLPSVSFYNEGDISATTLLSINAASIFNSGRLETSEGGRLIILSTNGTADLTRSSIRVGPATGLSALCDVQATGASNYFPDASISDLYWGAGRNNAIGTNGSPVILASLPFGGTVYGSFTLPVPFTPYHESISLSAGRPFTNRFTFLPAGCGTNYRAFVLSTNTFDLDTGLPLTLNTIVFVPDKTTLIESNLDVAVRFIPDQGPAGVAFSPVVELRSIDFDIVEQQFSTNYITFIDSTSAQTNVILARPFNTGTGRPASTRRPSTYNIIRGRYCFFDDTTNFVAEPNTPYDSNIFSAPLYVTNRASTIYAAYSAQIGVVSNTATLTPNLIRDDLFALGANPAATDPTNFTGKVEIVARGLNLDNARIRAENFISIKAENLTSNFVAQMDAPYIDYNVASTNSPLVISNLTPSSVSRLSGQISAWTGVWTAPATNQFGATNLVRFHVLLLDNCLRSEQPVTMNRFSVRTPQLTIYDNLLINSGVLLNAPTLTIKSNVTLALPQRADWAYTNVQNLLNFTNEGIVNVQGGVYFGAFESGHLNFFKPKKGKKKKKIATPPPLQSFENSGSISGSAFFLRSTNVSFTGFDFVPSLINANNGVVSVVGSQIHFDNSYLFAGSDAEYHGQDLRINSSYLTAGTTSNQFGRAIRGSLTLNATNSLGDAGLNSGNLFLVTAGVRAPTFPAFPGDFLGTHIYVAAGPFWEAPIVWPAQNLGAAPAGFSNNLAVGRLTLDGAQGNLFRFRSPTTNTAIYVDYLELLNTATNYNFALGVSPGFTIYFADANISPDKLDAQGGGRIKWVSNFLGAQSSTNILYPNGITYTFNAGVIRSMNRDDDGDGFENGIDCTPIPVPGFDTFGQQCVNPAPLASSAAKALTGYVINLDIALAPNGGGVVLNWDAPANSANTVEFTESLSAATWQTLTNFINGPVDARVTVKDAAVAPTRIYRVLVGAGKP
jgi:hypothetical protein